MQNITLGTESHRAFTAPPGASPRDGCAVTPPRSHVVPTTTDRSSSHLPSERASILHLIARGRSRSHGRRPSFRLPSRKAGATSDLPVRNSQFMKSRHDWMQCDDKCFVSKSEGFSLPLIGLSRNAPWASFSWIHSDCKSMCRCLPNPRLLAIPLAAAESQCSSRGRTTPKSCISPW